MSEIAQVVLILLEWSNSWNVGNLAQRAFDSFDRWPALGDWLRSPGFGGAAAVVAASIAYVGSRAVARDDREARIADEQKSQWWRRAQWALDLTLSQNETDRAVGFEVLNALAQSEWAEQHEGDVIAAATDRVLSDEEVQEVDDSTPRSSRRILAPRLRRFRSG